jgi:HAD superfamily (subfamily IA) hydrolase, TIGR02254
MKRYELILLDADETLFDFKKAERDAFDKAAARFGIATDAGTFAAYDRINKDLWKRLERGEIDQKRLRTERFRLLAEELRLSFDPVEFGAAFVERLSKGAFLLEGAAELCDYLAPKYRLAILTNGIEEVQVSRLALSSIRDRISAILVSERAGSAKPDPAFFEYACAELGFADKARMLMVGDSLSSDIRGGVNFGIDTCWVNFSGAINETELKPTYEVRSLAEIMRIL